ncbi:hypothetical protein PpBr36_02178 [Pyricularia pennisetigena]|uniref:hypothetical protein n=1 Tax=Pyricularia pennisetigena TaxID=1578925 RepID=UPI00114DB578|nr:hypothetical protein PpBr36_02178 [Pyricularia pennisetigena]TLS31204.1 hypothetical protein PpBr36_02178 [Pyricularia pennisetigena]
MAGKAILLSLLAATCLASEASKPIEEKAPIILGSYIVEYEDGQMDTDAFRNEIASDAHVKMDLKFELFKGASIQFHDSDHVEETASKIAGMPSIKRMWPQRQYKIPDYQVSWAGNMPDAQANAVMRRQSDGNDTFTPHLMTQVNQLRNKGFVGKGVKVAVIDSGVDYKHPALGGCFGPDCLVSFGNDLVGDAFNGTNTPIPDNDPMDCGGHGTHVSGIIAAQTNNPFGIIGAATGVTMGHYRVFGCEGATSDDVLIQAYNMAYQDGADLITASIGGSSGWPEQAWAVAVTRIVEKGVPCVLAAGNDGATGMFFSSSAADARGATAIASFDNSITPQLLSNATYRVDGGQEVAFSYTAGTPSKWANVTLPLYAVNFDTNDAQNACNPLPDNTPDLSNSIVLIRRGTCAFTQKATNVRAKGAKYIVFYNNAPGTASISVAAVDGILGAATVDAETGKSWIAELSAGRNVTLAMTDPLTAPKFLVNAPNSASGGAPSAYSSWGPTFEGQVKPQVAAPGGNILSTYPLAKGGYAVLSGTSMACPLTAGAYALIMNVRGIKDPKTLENLVAATAKPTLFNSGTASANYLAPIPQQGAGLLQAYDAAYTTTLLSASSLAFNDTDNFVPVQNFTISNNGSSSVTYTLSHRGAATAFTFSTNASDITPAVFPNELVATYANLQFSQEKLEIAAGGNAQIAVTVTPPTGLDVRRLPVYSGYVTINGTDGSSFSLPYMGILGSIHAQRTLDPQQTFLSSNQIPSNFTEDNPPRVPAGHQFDLPPPGEANNTQYVLVSEMPRLSINLAWGTPLLRADVVAIRDNATETEQPAEETEVLGLKTAGSLRFFPQRFQSRTRSFVRWDGILDSGKYAPPGQYKIVFRALRVFGDSEKKEEYDAVETVPFKIKYINK